MLHKAFLSSYFDANNECKYLSAFGVNILVEKTTMQNNEIHVAPIDHWFRSKPRLSFTTTLDYIIKKYPKFSQICLFNSNIGETFLLMLHAEEFVKKRGLDNCIFVFNNDGKRRLFNRYYPKLDACSLKLSPYINDYIKKNEFMYKNIRIYSPFYTTYFKNVEKRICRKGEHFYEILKRANKLNQVPNLARILNLPDRPSEKFTEYARLLGKDFILLCPESNSCKTLPTKFWTSLIKLFRKQGYSVYCNSANPAFPRHGAYNFPISLSEIQEMAENAKAIIGLRSGIFDLMMPFGKNFYAIYTPFPRRGFYKFMSSHNVLQGFSLKKLKFDNNKTIHEYDYNLFSSADELQLCIIDSI